MPDRNEIKDDWPQSLVMSMGTLFLLVGVSLDIIRFLDQRTIEQRSREQRTKPSREHPVASDGRFGVAHPGSLTLLFGLGLTLLGYLKPMKRAK